jgi:choline-glycine betaine transporter
MAALTLGIDNIALTVTLQTTEVNLTLGVLDLRTILESLPKYQSDAAAIAAGVVLYVTADGHESLPYGVPKLAKS